MNNNDKKRSINVSTIGHIDHGKTTLTSAITHIASKLYGGDTLKYDQIDSAKEEKARGITINAAHIKYKTVNRNYIHTDCPGHADYIKNMILGSTGIDIGILVVSATDGIMPQTVEHLLLISRLEVPSLVIVINKMDMIGDDLILADLVEEEVKERCEKYGYTNVPVIRTSAKSALEGDEGEYGVPSIQKLLETIDQADIRSKSATDPFYLSVEGVCQIPGRGPVATGRIIRGTVNKGQDVDLLCAKGTSVIKTVVTELHMFREAIETATAGDDVGILLRGVKKEDIRRGDLICAVGSGKAAKRVRAQLYVINTDEGGRKSGFTKSYITTCFVNALNVTVKFNEFEDVEIACPGDSLIVDMSFDYKVAVEKNVRIILREGKCTVACGVILDLIE